MTLTPDERWSAHQINSFDEYSEKVAKRIYLKPVVDKHVRGIFRLVQRLIDFAYYEYEFFDLASMKALLAFELSLKNRYKSFKNTHSGNLRTLKEYIEWFWQNGYFETDSKRFLDQIRNIRNNYAHPNFHSFGGPMVSWPIMAVADLINDLYEDVNLRKLRKQETEKINKLLHEMTQSGGILKMNDGTNHPVHLFSLAFFNNKHIEKKYHFVYKPIFKIPDLYFKGGSIPVYPAIDLVCHSLQINTIELIAFGKNGEEVFRLSTPKADQQTQLHQWHRQYSEYINVFPHFPQIHGQMTSKALSATFSDFYRDI